MITVSGKCMCNKCESRTGDIYRMIGSCSNCGTTDILMLFRAGDKTRPLDCPVCGVWHGVRASRLPTPEEIPADAT